MYDKLLKPRQSFRIPCTSGNQKKEGKMGRECGMSAGNLQEGGDSEHLGLDGKINVKRDL